MARILIFTGEGKGKTTAALGMVLRCLGHGKRSLVVQFIKSNDETGEYKFIDNNPKVDIILSGLGFTPKPEDSVFKEHCQAAVNGLKDALAAIQRQHYDLIILDEVCLAIYKKLLEEKAVIDFFEHIPEEGILVFTGRYASDALIARADTVTNMQVVKHGLRDGIPAQEGVEW